MVVVLVLFGGALLAPGGQLSAEEPRFRLRELNRSSTYSACAAIDVNGDQVLDVVCGGWWYEAPSWKRHFLRNVPRIRGRFDGYSCQPIDVNGDGWVDFVSANLRSRKLSWVEHPGPGGGLWVEHVVAYPGGMETGRLLDIDGNGKTDFLPNSTSFSTWWEISPVEWTRHELPAFASDHGQGFGDVDGDGRGDIVSPKGWLKGPSDARRGSWSWHPEFDLGPSSIPILVHDVDRDGDNDLIWGMGHDFGLYWLEQTRSFTKAGKGGSERRWIRHAIDTSYSQLHAVLLADIDGDGQDDVVTGKRYMAHEGHDPGAYDALVIYWYRFEPRSKTWRRAEMARGHAGIGLDPKAVDLDADGDVDFLAPGRSGLYWIENLRIQTPTNSTPSNTSDTPSPKPTVATTIDHSKLLVYRDEAAALRPAVTAVHVGQRREDILRGMQEVMGPLPGPERRVPLDIEYGNEVAEDGYVRKTISFAAEPGDRVPAFLLVPAPLPKRAPAMLCLHQTVAIGKEEPAGLGGQPTLHYAHELAKRGYVCIVPDYPSFGEYKYDFQGTTHKRYASGSMKAIWNNIRAIDVLESLPEVDPTKIGCIGHSLGGHNALFTAVFDQRIEAVVTSCGFTPFHDYYGGNLKGWSSVRYMPRIRDIYESDPSRMPFDFYEVIGALVPRAVFVNAPTKDHNFAVAGVRRTIDEARKIYRLRGVEDSLTERYPESEHDFPDAIRHEAYEWLSSQLK